MRNPISSISSSVNANEISCDTPRGISSPGWAHRKVCSKGQGQERSQALVPPGHSELGSP